MDQTNDWQKRTELLLGTAQTNRLLHANVLVVGLGGVGGLAAEMIGRAGVGRMTIVDGDLIENSNRNRQIVALTSTAGRPKTEVLAERLRDINPHAVITPITEYLRDQRMEEVLASEPFDCVLDAIDTLSPKVFLALYCVKHKIPLISCMGSGARMNPELVRCVDLEKSEHCTLARAVRKRLHRLGVFGGYQVVFSPEDPVSGSVKETDEGEVSNKRSVTGTISYMPAVFGCHCAAAVIRTIMKQS